MIKLFKTCKIN